MATWRQWDENVEFARQRRGLAVCRAIAGKRRVNFSQHGLPAGLAPPACSQRHQVSENGAIIEVRQLILHVSVAFSTKNARGIISVYEYPGIARIFVVEISETLK